MARRTLTPEERETIILRYARGDPVAEIAADLRTSPSHIRVVAHRGGAARPLDASPDVAKPSVARARVDEPGGLAARLAALQGLTPASQEAEMPLEDERLRSFIDEPEALFLWLGVSLFPYQQAALALVRANDRVALVWPRQHGKDLLTALYGLWLALVTPGSIVVCVSPSQRQSDLWMDRLKAFALSKREIRDSVTDISTTELHFANGSKVYSLPSGAQGSATIRGFSRVTALVVNEAAWVGEETFQAAEPFLAVTGKGSKLILASTPFGQSGYLWRAFNSDLFAKSHVTSVQNPLIPADFIDKERASMDSMSFAAEWQAIFLSGQSSYFPTDLVTRCVEAYPLVENPLPEHAGMTFYLGCDWARIAGADRTVLTVLGVDENGHGRVLWMKAFDGIDYVTQANYVVWLDSRWHFASVYSDASNHAENDLLRSRGVSVEPVVFTVPSKIELFGRLKNALEAGKLTIPSHPDLLRELSTFEYKISDHGNLLLHHVAGGHDDFPDSLALAARRVTTGDEIPAEPGNAADLWRAAAEALEGRPLVDAPVESAFNAASGAARPYRGRPMGRPKCPWCGAESRNYTLFKVHQGECPERPKEG